ncbi:MAG: hypothetical protein H7331_04775 [Bacteroidia bacterium]|nr:hypothetical protein [Bacteroidia bacterium]
MAFFQNIKLSTAVATFSIGVALCLGTPVLAQRMDTENLNQLNAGKEKSITRAQIKNNTEKNYKAFSKRQSKSARRMMRADAKKSKRINEGQAPHTKMENFFKRFKKKNTSTKGSKGRK